MPIIFVLPRRILLLHLVARGVRIQSLAGLATILHHPLVVLAVEAGAHSIIALVVINSVNLLIY